MKKTDNKKFSIALMNYNNFDLIFESIDSICNQTYKNIELVISDDCSLEFDKDSIVKYINKKRNDIDVLFVINEKNIGTVKTANKIIDKMTGDYYLIMASDDCLAGKDVISNFVKKFDETDCNIITGQWILCDENLKVLRKSLSVKKMNIYNNDQKKLLFDMCKHNMMGAGATVYRKCIFDKYKFDEEYKYLEDWPFWLNLLINNEKMYFVDFDALLHRAGGISSSSVLSEFSKKFYLELLMTYSDKVLPNIKMFSKYQQWQVLKSYKFSTEYYGQYINTDNFKKEVYKRIFNDKKIKQYWYIDELNPKVLLKIKDLCFHNKVVPASFVITLLLSVFVLNFKASANLKIILVTGMYFLLYILFVILREIKVYICERLRRNIK